MKPYAVIDLHCDTLADCMFTDTGSSDTLDDPKRALSLSAIPQGVSWTQFFAVWIQDEYTGDAALRYFDRWADSFYRQTEKFSDRITACRSAADIELARSQGKTAAVLTVENGSVLGGRLENVKYLADRGVRAMTVVWNGENEIASGNDTDRGFSDFGRRVIPELERCGILVDVSHLNDRGFYELLDIAEKPFLATHSNLRSICPHKRNLTGDMVRRMVERDCLIGINYYTFFIEENGEVDSPEQLYRHIDRFLELGAEKNLALGSDFDGADLPEFLNSPAKVADFYEYLLSRGLSERVVNGIYCENAMSFLRRNMT